MSEHMSDVAFGKVFAGLIGGMVALAVVLIILANVLGGGYSSKTSDFMMTVNDQQTGARVAPVASMAVGEVAAVTAPAGEAPLSGESVYQSTCSACHATGVAGAPKFGDGAAWEPRIAQGTEVLYQHAINGFNAMPPKGGNTNLSDDAVKAAVNYMTGKETPAAEGGGETSGQQTAATEQPAEAEQTAAAASDIDGAAIYQATCSACHAAGVAGAPKFGDAAAWQPRIAQGIEVLYQHAINGLNVMPPKGGNMSLSDDEVRAAVDYMAGAVN